MNIAIFPLLMEFLPKVGPITFSSTDLRGAGKDPDLINRANSEDSSIEKFPCIVAIPF